MFRMPHEDHPVQAVEMIAEVEGWRGVGDDDGAVLQRSAAQGFELIGKAIDVIGKKGDADILKALADPCGWKLAGDVFWMTGGNQPLKTWGGADGFPNEVSGFGDGGSGVEKIRKLGHDGHLKTPGELENSMDALGGFAVGFDGGHGTVRFSLGAGLWGWCPRPPNTELCAG